MVVKMEGELVLVSIISTVGMIVVTQLITHNFFKKELFKADLQRTKRLDSLKLQQLKKEMGLTKKIISADDSQQKLDLGPIINAITGGGSTQEYDDDEEDDDGGGNPLIDVIANVAKSNPDLVKNVIGKITGPGNKTEEVHYLGE
jgi:hypothetical protein